MNIGDRVIVNGNQSFKVFINQPGRIVDIMEGFFGIEFDDYIGGHDCIGKGKKGHCWIVLRKFITIEKVDIKNFKEELDKITL